MRSMGGGVQEIDVGVLVRDIGQRTLRMRG
jgi:hypothetical protein